MEQWKPIEFGNGRFSVSNTGKVKNNVTGKILAQQIQNSGYYMVHLNYQGRRKASTVHRLVAIAFISNPDMKSMVDHIDCNKVNNNASNLRWVTAGENGQYASENGLFTNAGVKAKERMSVIGKQYAKQNTAYLLAETERRKRPVIQLTLTGEFIKEWPSTRAVRDSKIASNINKVLKGLYKQSGGYKWVYK